MKYLIFNVFIGCAVAICGPDGKIPEEMWGRFYSYEGGQSILTDISELSVVNKFFDGECIDLWKQYQQTPGYWDQVGLHTKILVKDKRSGSTNDCYYCLEKFARTINVIQLRREGPNCVPKSSRAPTLDQLCGRIDANAELLTSFRDTPKKVNCKNTFEGVYHFTYQIDIGGGGICDSPDSKIIACQAEGSQYLDNEVFTMNSGYCPVLGDELGGSILYYCLGIWRDDGGKVYAAVSNAGQERGEDRFRCLLTRDDQQMERNQRRWVMSNTPVCSTLVDPYTGPLKLVVAPTLPQVEAVAPSCNLPRNFSGQWFHTGEYDSDVTINGTHMVFRTAIDQYKTRETVFVCQQAMAGRYMMAAFIIGRCELDYVCFDFLPRHQNIIRFRMGKPFRHRPSSAADPQYLERTFRRSCYWTSFTFDREEPDFHYQTLILNPPTPIQCPIRGRYKFEQHGQENEKFKTRIPGVTERPWMQVDCKDKESDFSVCLKDTNHIEVDAERCVTVDHIAKPIGEYDFADRTLTCAGYWMEDYLSYLITYDDEDPISKFRCWVFERIGVRDVAISRAFRATCGMHQTSRSRKPSEGVSLQLMLKENEYIHDDCPMAYTDGRNPWGSEADQALTLRMFSAGTTLRPLVTLLPLMRLLC